MISARLTFAVYLLAACAGAALYQTSYAVDEVRAKIASTDRQIVSEQENIQVLGAEWTYLTEPSRIEALASKYLHLEATKTQRVAALHDMNRVVAQRVDPSVDAPTAAIAAATISKPPLIAPMPEPIVASTPAPVIKPIVTASRSASPMLSTVSQKLAPSSQPTTPNSVKLLLASFQAR